MRQSTAITFIPARFLLTTAQFLATIVIYTVKDDYIRAALPLNDMSNYKAFEQSFMAALILSWVCFFIQYIGLFGGWTMFNEFLSAFDIVAHFCGTIVLSFFMTETWHCQSFCGLPALLELGFILRYIWISCKIAPSILSSDFARLADECHRMVDSGADYLHVDVMDGHFVPNLTLGPPIVKSLRKHTSAFLDVHLMVQHPEQWVNDFAKAGCDLYTFHIEACHDVKSLILKIKECGMKVGIALKPKTLVDQVIPYVPLIDQVLIMTVEPGFGGQSFMKEMMVKVKRLRSEFPTLDIQVDGGIGPGETIEACSMAGANVIVAGTSIFSSSNPKQTIQELRSAVEKYTHAL